MGPVPLLSQDKQGNGLPLQVKGNSQIFWQFFARGFSGKSSSATGEPGTARPLDISGLLVLTNFQIKHCGK